MPDECRAWKQTH